MGPIPGLGRSPEGGHSNLPRYPCLENPMDRGAWWATVRMAGYSPQGPKELDMTKAAEHVCTIKRRTDEGHLFLEKVKILKNNPWSKGT